MIRSTALLLVLLAPTLLARPLISEEEQDVPAGTSRSTEDIHGPLKRKCDIHDIYCLAVYDPVCTQRDETYSNGCEMRRASCLDGIHRYVVYRGECGQHM